MKRIMLTLALLFYSPYVNAQNTSGGAPPGGSGKGGFGVSVTLFDSMGTMKNSTGTIASRSMNNIGLSAVPSFSFGMVSALLYIDYVLTGQVTDPNEVSNTNLGGSGWIGAPGIGFEFSKISLAASYVLYGNYVASKKTAANEESSYTKPSGFVVQLGYQLNSPWTLHLIYRSVSYAKAIVGDAFSDIKDDPVQSSSYGLGIGAAF
ncbi:MAG: hypothetical protein ABL958_06290 [Bdellovibrionia bacterium]